MICKAVKQTKKLTIVLHGPCKEQKAGAKRQSVPYCVQLYFHGGENSRTVELNRGLNDLSQLETTLIPEFLNQMVVVVKLWLEKYGSLFGFCDKYVNSKRKFFHYHHSIPVIKSSCHSRWLFVRSFKCCPIPRLGQPTQSL